VRFDSKPTFRAIPLGLALLAVFRFVDESLFLKELLFTRRKNKHHTTTYTQDISVRKGHNPPSKLSRFREGSTGDSSPSVKSGSVSAILCLSIWKTYTDLKQALSRCVVCARSQSSFKKSALSPDYSESSFTNRSISYRICSRMSVDVTKKTATPAASKRRKMSAAVRRVGAG